MTNEMIYLHIILALLLIPILTGGFLYLFDYIADSDIWIKKEDRDK
jgi:hypothetical protein